MTDQGSRKKRRPTAFRIDEDQAASSSAFKVEEGPRQAHVLPEFEPAPIEEGPLPPEPAAPKGRFGKLLAIALGGLISLSIGLAIDGLIRDLFTRADWLGWLGAGLAATAVLALVGLVLREVAGLFRLARIDGLRKGLEIAVETDDAKLARTHLRDLSGLYAARPETARGRSELAGHMAEIIDGRDLVKLAERDVLAPLDKQARAVVKDSAKRISIVTAVSPRALIDLLAVLFENLRMIRKLSLLYGGRPGTLGFLRLARQVATHLALTGGMAAGDSLVSQVLGHGLAARVSARLGEGAVNGLLTARIGIAALEVCRPAPFVGVKPPTVSDIMGAFLTGPDALEPPAKNGSGDRDQVPS